MASPIPARRVDLDWLRIAAFGLLIFYHIGMFYVTWGFHVKSSRASETIEPLMLLSNPWRLTLLFLISGVATRFMFDKMSPGAFVGSRMGRLLPPLVFGIFVIVPPQTYFQIVEALNYSGSIPDFYLHYVTASGHWRIDGEPLITPTWNHLWFVAYLIVYTLLIMGVGPLLKRLPAMLFRPLGSGPAIFVLPWIAMFAIRYLLDPVFPETHALFNDWGAHALYFSAFALGYAVAKHEAFFETAQRWRWLTLGLALLGWCVWVGPRIVGWTPPPGAAADIVGVAAREGQAWFAILACIGFARRHLRRDGPVRRYLTDAIFPFYIIHQTTIVAMGFYLDPLQLPLWLEASILVLSTIASCWIGYEIARRVGFLRPLFGLKPRPRAQQDVPQSA
ncbi:MAG: acyltransferase family protein [Hyphomonadaceae bacterium]